MFVRERMTRHPLTVSPDASVHKAQVLMCEGHVRQLPVVDHGRLVGIVSMGDIYRRAPLGTLVLDAREAEQLLDHVLIGGVMTLQPEVVEPDTPLLDAARRILQRRIGALPVVEQGQLVGILTGSDVLQALLSALGTNGNGGGRSARD